MRGSIILIIVSAAVSITASAQQKQQLQKSWTKTAMYLLPGNTVIHLDHRKPY